MISDWHIFELRQKYPDIAEITPGIEWICNPAKLDFHPNPNGPRIEDQRHDRWLKFLNSYPSQSLAHRLSMNLVSLDDYQERKIIGGLEFDIEMKGIDKVEQDFLPKIQKLTEKKEAYDRLKLREIFDLQRRKIFVDDDQPDLEMSWLPGTTLDEKFDFFVKRAKDKNILETLDEIPNGKFDLSYLY